MTERSGFSDADREQDPSRLVGYLDYTTSILGEVKARMKASLELARGSTFIDIGCGVGQDVACDDRAFGVDLSVKMLAEAKRRSPHIRVAAADGRRLPFADRSFDGCRIERVLMHVAEPKLVLQEAHRTLVPGARIAVWEPDFESLLIDATDAEVSRSVAVGAGRRVVNGRIGRELGRVMQEVGFEDVDVQLEPGGARSLNGLRMIFGFDAVTKAVVDSGETDGPRMHRWLSELEERERRGTMWAFFARFFATARRAA
jgi:SAM-dependent methyltransferase